MFDLYAQGITEILRFDVAVWLFVGSFVGILIGAMPGLTVTMGVAVLAPLTFNMDAIPAFALLLSAYAAATYGGSIAAILLRIPGALPSVMTLMDGHPMAQRGEAGKAISIATTASLFGGLVSAAVLAMLAPPLAAFALKFSAPDYLAVAIFALSIIAYVSHGSLMKGFLSGTVGLALATVGLDPNLGVARFTFGSANLMSGIGLVPVMIGIFGLAEVLSEVGKSSISDGRTVRRIRSSLINIAELLRLLPACVKASLIGVFVGVLPAAGSSTASIVAYGIGKRTSPRGDKYGTGEPEGLATAETANNASTGGDLVPTLSLGIPGSSSCAVLMGALILHGLQPGPLLFVQYPNVVSAIFILFFLSNFVFFAFGMVGAPLFSRVLELPKNILMPLVAMLCVVGAFAIQNSVFDVGIMLASAAIGLMFRATGVPVAPLVLGLILGPMVESNLQRTLILSYGSITDVFLRPISLSFLIATVLFLVAPAVFQRLRGSVKSNQPSMES